MIRRLVRPLVPDRLVPIALLIAGRPEAAAHHLQPVEGLARDDEVARLEARIEVLADDQARLREEFGAAVDFFDRNLRAAEQSSSP